MSREIHSGTLLDQLGCAGDAGGGTCWICCFASAPFLLLLA